MLRRWIVGDGRNVKADITELGINLLVSLSATTRTLLLWFCRMECFYCRWTSPRSSLEKVYRTNERNFSRFLHTCTIVRLTAAIIEEGAEVVSI
jgi:hypothetical protein